MTEKTDESEAPGTAVAPVNGTSVALTAQRAGEMAQVEIDVAKARAKVAAAVIEENKLYKLIKGKGSKQAKKYVFVDGWTTLARLYNYVPDIERVESLEGTGYGYVATARLINDAGQVVARAEASASTSEERWSGTDDYALRSMAQTRAISKVCRVALSWVMVLAGFQGTPAEEMPGDRSASKRQAKPMGLKARQDILRGLAKDRIESDGWDATAEVLNGVHDGAMTQIDDKWGLRWENIDKDGTEALIEALTPAPEEAEPVATEQPALTEEA